MRWPNRITSRWQIWRAKVLAGLGLAFIQILLLVALAAALDLVPGLGWAVAVVVYSLLAFVWGVFGSTLARTTLGSVGAIVRTLGEFDVLMLAATSTREELMDLVLNGLGKSRGIRRTETFDACATVKHSYTWARIL